MTRNMYNYMRTTSIVVCHHKQKFNELRINACIEWGKISSDECPYAINDETGDPECCYRATKKRSLVTEVTRLQVQ